VRTFQATLGQLDKPLEISVERPSDAVPGRGGIRVHLRNRLADELAGVKEYMSFYPYVCLEQLVSQAVALRDEGRWQGVMSSLPSYLDRDGLAKYFPIMDQGSDVLTSYLLAIAEEAGWKVPEDSRARMVKGLRGFVQGRVVRQSALPTADVAIRKVAALDALARTEGVVEPQMQPMADLGSVGLDESPFPRTRFARSGRPAGAGRADHPFAAELSGNGDGLFHRAHRRAMVAYDLQRRERQPGHSQPTGS
jgi:hypothetical protein